MKSRAVYQYSTCHNTIPVPTRSFSLYNTESSVQQPPRASRDVRVAAKKDVRTLGLANGRSKPSLSISCNITLSQEHHVRAATIRCRSLNSCAYIKSIESMVAFEDAVEAQRDSCVNSACKKICLSGSIIKKSVQQEFSTQREHGQESHMSRFHRSTAGLEGKYLYCSQLPYDASKHLKTTEHSL